MPIEFIEETHQYRVKETGKFLPSVSGIIKQVLGSPYGGHISPEVLAKAAARGTAIHLEIELYELHGTLGSSDQYKNYVALKNKEQWEVLETERLVYLLDEDFGACGTLDQIMRYQSDRHIADIKNTQKLHLTHVTWQESLYRMMWQLVTGETISNIGFVYHLLPTKGTLVDLKLYSHDDCMDMVKAYYKQESWEVINPKTPLNLPVKLAEDINPTLLRNLGKVKILQKLIKDLESCLKQPILDFMIQQGCTTGETEEYSVNLRKGKPSNTLSIDILGEQQPELYNAFKAAAGVDELKVADIQRILANCSTMTTGGPSLALTFKDETAIRDALSTGITKMLT